jgi:K+-transporting ATPase A subunit
LVEYLYTNKQFEILAYFVSCYGNSKDVNIKEFIHQNCKTAINTISKFVNEYNIEEY